MQNTEGSSSNKLKSFFMPIQIISPVTLWQAAAVTGTVVTEGTPYDKMHRKVKDKVSLWFIFYFFCSHLLYPSTSYTALFSFVSENESQWCRPFCKYRHWRVVPFRKMRVGEIVGWNVSRHDLLAAVSFLVYQIESVQIQQHIKLNICRTDSNLITKLFQFH